MYILVTASSYIRNCLWMGSVMYSTLYLNRRITNLETTDCIPMQARRVFGSGWRCGNSMFFLTISGRCKSVYGRGPYLPSMLYVSLVVTSGSQKSHICLCSVSPFLASRQIKFCCFCLLTLALSVLPWPVCELTLIWVSLCIFQALHDIKGCCPSVHWFEDMRY